MFGEQSINTEGFEDNFVSGCVNDTGNVEQHIAEKYCICVADGMVEEEWTNLMILQMTFRGWLGSMGTGPEGEMIQDCYREVMNL